MSGAGARYHKCGQAIWVHHKLSGGKWVTAYASLEGHCAITHCPKCEAALREIDMCREKPK